MVNLKINDIPVSVPEGTTILEAARSLNINIPTLCYLKDINEIGACRMCIVEIKGSRALQASCVYPVSEGIEVYTNTPLVRKTRRTNLELILSDHNRECTSCIRSGNCELQKISKDLGVEEVRFVGERSGKIVEVNRSIVRDESKCIYCKRCVAVCANVQGIGALGPADRGFEAKIRPVFDKPLDSVNCISCGQCVVNCPVGALYEADGIKATQSYIDDKELHTIAVIAPAVRSAIGEEFGYPIGTDTTGKMVSAAKKIGFDKVFDVNFSADLTIMEEGTELIGRVTNGGKLPMITSCSPGWINYCEKFYPGQLENLSTCKSPQGMLGAILKTYYAQVNGIDADKIRIVSIMPCTAKKTEIERPQLRVNDRKDIDVVITTRELAHLIKSNGLDYENLSDDDFDDFYDQGSGAGVIFGATGGVMEAALRTAVEVITGQESEKVEYLEARGIGGIKEFDVRAGDLTLKACVVSGGSNIKVVMDQVARGESPYHFIEIMACPGGCVNGGGQPIVSSVKKAYINVRELRAKVLYDRDANVHKERKSHKNANVQKLYEDFLTEPNSHKSHELLHTSYSPQEKYK
jgi:NADP-reducing hydrogenase subunit HndD